MRFGATARWIRTSGCSSALPKNWKHARHKENSEIQAQIDKYVTEQRAKIQSNNEEVSREKERFTGWRLKKQQEEKKIAEAVGYFVTRKSHYDGRCECAAAPIENSAAFLNRRSLCGNG